MKIYFASGYSIMNRPGGEREMYILGVRHRLVSFYDVDRGNDIFAVFRLKEEVEGKKGAFPDDQTEFLSPSCS